MNIRTRSRILHLVAINAFVGAMVGLERTVLPLIAEADFGIASRAAGIAFIATFGLTKATFNAFAGVLSERWGRKSLLVAGWIAGVPVPLVIILAPSWGWILFANVLLGVNQALTWSMTVIMKVDLVEPRKYGLVIGLNEFSGYAGMAVTAAATGWLASAWGLRPEPFYLGIGLAVTGLGLSLLVRDTAPGQSSSARDTSSKAPSLGRTVARRSLEDPRLSTAGVCGLVTNLKDGVLWGLLPILLASRGLTIERVGLVVALYPLVWAVSQLLFGPMSDRVGRRGLIASGMVVQGAGVALFATGQSYLAYLGAAVTVGIGTGMVYPTLLAFVSETAEAAWRASALGFYRFWRDLGYALGALGGGVVADGFGIPTSLLAAAGIALLAGVVFHVGTRRP